MSLKITCEGCKVEIHQAGALLFGSPRADGSCLKTHLCSVCAQAVCQFIGGILQPPPSTPYPE